MKGRSEIIGLLRKNADLKPANHFLENVFIASDVSGAFGQVLLEELSKKFAVLVPALWETRVRQMGFTSCTFVDLATEGGLDAIRECDKMVLVDTTEIASASTESKQQLTTWLEAFGADASSRGGRAAKLVIHLLVQKQEVAMGYQQLSREVTTRMGELGLRSTVFCVDYSFCRDDEMPDAAGMPFLLELAKKISTRLHETVTLQEQSQIVKLSLGTSPRKSSAPSSPVSQFSASPRGEDASWRSEMRSMEELMLTQGTFTISPRLMRSDLSIMKSDALSVMKSDNFSVMSSARLSPLPVAQKRAEEHVGLVPVISMSLDERDPGDSASVRSSPLDGNSCNTSAENIVLPTFFAEIDVVSRSSTKVPKPPSQKRSPTSSSRPSRPLHPSGVVTPPKSRDFDSEGFHSFDEGRWNSSSVEGSLAVNSDVPSPRSPLSVRSHASVFGTIDRLRFESDQRATLRVEKEQMGSTIEYFDTDSSDDNANNSHSSERPLSPTVLQCPSPIPSSSPSHLTEPHVNPYPSIILPSLPKAPKPVVRVNFEDLNSPKIAHPSSLSSVSSTSPPSWPTRPPSPRRQFPAEGPLKPISLPPKYPPFSPANSVSPRTPFASSPGHLSVHPRVASLSPNNRSLPHPRHARVFAVSSPDHAAASSESHSTSPSPRPPSPITKPRYGRMRAESDPLPLPLPSSEVLTLSDEMYSSPFELEPDRESVLSRGSSRDSFLPPIVS